MIHDSFFVYTHFYTIYLLFFSDFQVFSWFLIKLFGWFDRYSQFFLLRNLHYMIERIVAILLYIKNASFRFRSRPITTTTSNNHFNQISTEDIYCLMSECATNAQKSDYYFCLRCKLFTHKNPKKKIQIWKRKKTEICYLVCVSVDVHFDFFFVSHFHRLVLNIKFWSPYSFRQIWL